jgi:hypothetical protein
MDEKLEDLGAKWRYLGPNRFWKVLFVLTFFSRRSNEQMWDVNRLLRDQLAGNPLPM